MSAFTEEQACLPIAVERAFFNPLCQLPYDLTLDQVYAAMVDFNHFLGFLNQQLYARHIPRLESFLMPANFSSLVGEFVSMTIPTYCSGLVKNRYHNGHPDLIPTGRFSNDAVQHTTEGVEIKSSRRAAGWQGHNPETVWLMVFHFDSNTPGDAMKKVGPRPFHFKGGYAARLEKEDWSFSGRSAASRRTITASVNQLGMKKLRANWVFQALQ